MSGERFDYSNERQRHEKFVGRAGLLARLDRLLVDSDADRWVVITGGPGMGKSAILAAWLARREAAGAVVPHHFIRRGAYDWDDPTQLVGSLVAQFEERFPDLREPDQNARMHPAARLARMLSRVAEKELGPRAERLVVLIDGLDEYDPPPSAPTGDPLAAFLPHMLPVGVSLLCATRPRHPYISSLQTRDGEFVQIDLDDSDSTADNDATVRVFWEQAAGPLGLDGRFIDEAVVRAGGNVQHAVQLRKYLAALPAEQRRVEDIPRGLAALIAKSWERIATDPIVVDGLGILCVAFEALTLDQIGAVAVWSGDAQRRAFVRGATELLVETRRPDGETEYRLHHDSIRAYIAKEIGTVAFCGHHRKVALRLATWPLPEETTWRRYALRHTMIHRADAGDWTDVWRLAADMSFLEAKCRELGVHETEADLTRLVERCHKNEHAQIRQRIGDLAHALARESHWLRTMPEATAALLWNRLRRSGWSANDLVGQLRVPAETSFLRVRHARMRESPALIRDLVGHSDSVTACAVTADGRRVVSASEDGALKVWEFESGRELTTLEGHTGGVNACAVTPDGLRVVSASDDGTLKVWDLESGRALVTLEGHTENVTACAVTADGRRVVSASCDRTLKVWDLESGLALATLEGHTGWVTACAVTADGLRVVSASLDQTLKVWDLESGRTLATLEGHPYMLACAVTPDARRVVSALLDQTLRVWDLESGRPLATLEGHTEQVKSCAVTPDGRRVVSASSDQTLKVWDLESGRELATLEGHTAGVTACVVTADGMRVISASRDEMLKIWHLEGEGELAALEGHASWVTGCATTADGRRAVSASTDWTLKVWDLESGRELATLEGHTGLVHACAVTPDSRRVVSASRDRTLKVWDLESGRELATLEGHTSDVVACAVTTNGEYVVSASDDKTLKVWDLESGQELATFEGHTDAVMACAVTADGRYVVSASWDETLKVWDLESGQELATLEGHTSRVRTCAVTPDGNLMVSAAEDRTLKVWDLKRGCVLANLEGHTHEVIACSVTEDGGRVVSASYDRTLRVWDLETYTCLLVHRGDAPYFAVATSATALIAGDRAGTVWFLDWPPSYRSDALLGASDGESFKHAFRPAHDTTSSRSLMNKDTVRPHVDIGILTIRDDEFRAVLDAFPHKAGAGVYKASREYILRHADIAGGERYTVAVLRQVEQGNGEAQDATRDLIEDLAPNLVLVVGIAGGLPSNDVRLGDVIISTRIHDFTVEARNAGQETTYAVTGGPVDKALAAAVATLAGREDDLGNWTAGLSSQPPVAWTNEGQLYGPPEWQSELREKLEYHHGESSTPRAPLYKAGPIASSDRLVKDPVVLFPWITTARNLLAVEMESGGVFRATRERCPMLAIRGISDIVGLKRADAWIEFACAAAAAFTRAFLRTRPVPVGSLPVPDPS